MSLFNGGLTEDGNPGPVETFFIAIYLLLLAVFLILAVLCIADTVYDRAQAKLEGKTFQQVHVVEDRILWF